MVNLICFKKYIYKYQNDKILQLGLSGPSKESKEWLQIVFVIKTMASY